VTVAALNSVTVDCPACGQPIHVPLTATTGEADGNTVPVTITPDLAPISAHAATHAAQSEPAA